MKDKKGIKLTYVGVWHFIRLTYRSVLFVLLLIGYIRYRFINGTPLIIGIEKMPAIIYVIWAVFVIEMIARFFPSKFESPGCQKQFASNYIKTGNTDIEIPDNNATFLVALVWIVFNGNDTPLQRILGMRYDMHTVLLPIPVVVPQEQMLRGMQDIQLGLRDDVYAAFLRTKDIHMEFAPAFRSAARKMGDHFLQTSREILRKHERIS